MSSEKGKTAVCPVFGAETRIPEVPVRNTGLLRCTGPAGHLFPYKVKGGKRFTDGDIKNSRIFAETADLVDAPPRWMKDGFTETSTGYGRRLNTGRKINFNGKLYRLYATCFSNNASVWFTAKGTKIFVT